MYYEIKYSASLSDSFDILTFPTLCAFRASTDPRSGHLKYVCVILVQYILSIFIACPASNTL